MNPRYRFVVIALLLTLVTPTFAQHVKDNAKFFSPDAIATAEQTLTGAKQAGRNVVVETYDAMPNGVKGNADYPGFSTKRAADLGADLYVVVVKNPSHVHVKSRDLKKIPQAEVDQVNQGVLAAFRDKQFDRGLSAITAMVAAVPDGTATQTAVSPTGIPSRSRSGTADPSSNTPAPVPANTGSGLFGGMSRFLCIGLAIFAVIFVVIKLLRGRRNQGSPYGGYGQPGQQMPGNSGYGPGNYPQGGAGGGGFGAGIGGGLLGGVLGSVIGNKVFGQGGQSAPPPDSGSSSASGNDSFKYTGGNGGGNADTQGYDAGGSFDSGDAGGSFDSGGDSGGDAGGDF